MGKKSKKKANRGLAAADLPPPPPRRCHWSDIEIPTPEAIAENPRVQVEYLEALNAKLTEDYDPPLENPKKQLWFSSEE